MNKNNFVIEKFHEFNIVRDDYFEGGTKKRAFSKLIHSISESELVYACDYYGYAAYAIALTAQEVNKKVTLFDYSPKVKTEIFQKTIELPNVTYQIIENTKNQVEVSSYAKEYAKEKGALFIPIGLDYIEFEDELVKVVKDADLNDAPEIWCISGSGTLARSLQRAYPAIPIHAVSVGTSNAHFEGVEYVYQAPEDLKEIAEIRPPYKSSLNYYAKTWRFILEKAKPGAYIWNVS